MEAQEEACRAFLNGGDWEVATVFKEVESGRRSDRPKLLEALAYCQKHKCKLLVAKIDRLARDVGFVTQLMESGVKFVAADMPEANELTIHIIAAMAQHESRMISERTKAALAVAKANGKKLGSKDIERVAVRGREARTDAAQEHAEGVYPVIERVRSLGITTLRGIAQELTERKIDTPARFAKKRKRKAVFGDPEWRPQQVKNVIDRIEKGK
tara:strand:- start:273 stop:911 length:639 start_codon:yes stop_codon:yes gene_type:complete